MKLLLHLRNLFFALSLLYSTTSKTYACEGKDIVFTNITITSIVDGTYYYSYEIKNTGTTDIILGQVVIQNYVSTDNQIGGDAAAGGAYISYQSTEILSPGEAYSGMFEAYPFQENPQSSYPYLIAHLSLNTNDECDVSNNNYVELIQTSTAIANPSLLAGASLMWDVENKSFTVTDWSGNNSQLQYSVYTPSGILMLSGNSQNNESTSIKSLSNGIYILQLSGGDKVYSKKINLF